LSEVRDELKSMNATAAFDGRGDGRHTTTGDGFALGS
jgi:hypothetical protein